MIFKHKKCGADQDQCTACNKYSLPLNKLWHSHVKEELFSLCALPKKDTLPIIFVSKIKESFLLWTSELKHSKNPPSEIAARSL
jgi:hypothetical protein